MILALAVIIGLAGALVFLALNRLSQRIHHMAIAVSDILTQIAAVSTDVDALIASQSPAPDLQPVFDALTALDTKVKAATPAPAP